MLELSVEGLAAAGEGVARKEGRAVFVPGALPGETVVARLTQEKKRYARAELVEIIEPSPARLTPPCPQQAACGGCPLQHLAYPEQLKWKRQWLVDALKRIGGLDIEVLPTIGAAQPFHYRDRVQLHIFQQDGVQKLGFYGRGGKEGVSGGPCLLMRPVLRELTALLQEYLPDIPGLCHVALRCDSGGDMAFLTLIGCSADQRLSALARELRRLEPRLHGVWANWGEPVYGVYGASWQKLSGADRLSDTFAYLRLEISPAAFTQVNSAQARLLYQRVADYAALSGAETLLDVYSGVGMIALYLAREARQVLGVEEYLPATVDAARNAELNGIANCRFEAGRAEDALTRLAEAGKKIDVAVLDPPRAGCGARALMALAELAPKRIVYVSCDPATLARDLRILTELGYAAREAQPLDMFPQTGHVEAICLLCNQ